MVFSEVACPVSTRGTESSAQELEEQYCSGPRLRAGRNARSGRITALCYSGLALAAGGPSVSQHVSEKPQVPPLPCAVILTALGLEARPACWRARARRRLQECGPEKRAR